MDLREYISEAISSHRNSVGKYDGEFPNERTKHREIIHWLEDNDFKFIGEVRGELDLLSFGGICYTRGTYDPKNPMSQWIKIYDDSKIVWIRTCSMWAIRKGTVFGATVPCQWCDADTVIYKDIDYEDIVKYYNEVH